MKRRQTMRNVVALCTCTALLIGGCGKDKPAGPLVPEQLTIVSGNNQQGWANTQLPLPLTAKVATSNGKGVSGVNVIFEIVSSWRGGATWADTATSDADGLAQTAFTLDFDASSDTVKATVAGMSIPPEYFTATATDYWGGHAPFALEPPPPGQGLQIAIGPFYVAPGSELQSNHFMKFPSDEDMDVSRVQFSYAPGSHHLNIYRNLTQDLPDGTEISFSGRFWEAPWALVTNSQQDQLTLEMPQGVALHIRAHQQLNVQTHYVNATTQDTPDDYGMIYVNFWRSQPGTVTAHLGSMVSFNTSIRLPPHEESSFTYEFAMSDSSFRAVAFPIRIFCITGHFHSRGKSFSVTHFPRANPGGWGGGADTNGVEVFHSAAWDEPPLQIYDPAFPVGGNDVMEFTTTYVNNTDQVITFGPHVETQEHANLFMYFYPSVSEDGDYINIGGHPK